MADGFYRLTYRDIAERLGISPDAARMKANRKAKAGHWRLLPDEAPGGERLVEIPSAELDDLLAKAASAAERSAPAGQPEQPAAAPSPAPAEQSIAAEQGTAADPSSAVEPYVPPKVSVSFAPQHPHLPPATAERSPSAEPAATPEQAAVRDAEQGATDVPSATGEQPAEAVRAEQAAPAVAPITPPEQAVAAEQAPATAAEQSAHPEQPAVAEQSPAAAVAEQSEAQAESRSTEDAPQEVAEGDPNDVLVSTLTTRNATLTNRLLEETNARKSEREELEASAVRERELRVEIERLSARVSELTAELEQARRPWYRGFFQGRYGDS